jgi:hypothetical protein
MFVYGWHDARSSSADRQAESYEVPLYLMY